MFAAERYLSCSVQFGHFHVHHIGSSPKRGIVSYWMPEVVAREADQRLDRVVDTLTQLDAVQHESLTRSTPFRLVFVAAELEAEVRRRSRVG